MAAKAPRHGGFPVNGMFVFPSVQDFRAILAPIFRSCCPISRGEIRGRRSFNGREGARAGEAKRGGKAPLSPATKPVGIGVGEKRVGRSVGRRHALRGEQGEQRTLPEPRGGPGGRARRLCGLAAWQREGKKKRVSDLGGSGGGILGVQLLLVRSTS